jgi:hypothetical protein
MIILDTNVVSEAMRPVPSTRVMEWLAGQPVSEICTTSVTQAEVLSGIAQMPGGRRRRELQDRAEILFREYFEPGILPFETQSAPQYATIVAARFALGRPVGTADAQIAAIARQHGAIVATRDTSDFEDCGIRLVNPWEA